MTLEETKEIIIRWVDSCESTFQLDLLLEVMDKFVYERFAGLVQVTDMDMARTDLKEAWLNRKLVVVQNQPKKDNSSVVIIGLWFARGSGE